MSIQFVLYFSLILFVLGLFGYIYKIDFISVMISFQLIIVAGLINFFSFSHFIYQGSTFDKSFIIIGLITMELFVFSLLFYKYSSRSFGKSSIAIEEYNLFSFSKSDWWGDDE